MKSISIPFQGSKLKLADKIIEMIPPANHFYDLFCGGGSVTGAALMSGKFKHVHFSDVSDTVLCVRDLLEGNLPDPAEWVSREDFYARKDSEPWIRVLWSFASNQRDYIYSRKSEPYKKAIHEMIYAPTPNERRLKFKEVCRLMYQHMIENEALTPLNARIWHIENHQRLYGDFNRQNGIYPPRTVRESTTWSPQNDIRGFGAQRKREQMQGGSCNPSLFKRGV